VSGRAPRPAPGWVVTARAAICLGVMSVALGGCSALGAPAAPSRSNASVARAQATHEYPAPTPRRQTAAGGARTATEAIRRFAGAYINWTARTVAADMRTLAAQSVGQARSALQLAAAQTASDYELRRGGISNSGSVEAVAPLPGGRGRYVVVTRELTSATGTTAYQGLRPAWHVAIATVASTPGGRRVLSGWQPES
jgi:hypothetical protein